MYTLYIQPNLSVEYLKFWSNAFTVKFRNLEYATSSGDEMANKDDVDVLFGIRNAYYTGNYQSCITEAQKIKKVLLSFVYNIGGY